MMRLEQPHYMLANLYTLKFILNDFSGNIQSTNVNMKTQEALIFFSSQSKLLISFFFCMCMNVSLSQWLHVCSFVNSFSQRHVLTCLSRHEWITSWSTTGKGAHLRMRSVRGRGSWGTRWLGRHRLLQGWRDVSLSRRWFKTRQRYVPPAIFVPDDSQLMSYLCQSTLRTWCVHRHETWGEGGVTKSIFSKSVMCLVIQQNLQICCWGPRTWHLNLIIDVW